MVAILSNLIRLILFPLLLFRARRAARRGAYLGLTIEGRVVELPPRTARLFRARRAPTPSLERLRELASLVAGDPDVSGLVVGLRAVSGGLATLQSLREVLASIRAAGKDVIAFLPWGADTRALYVASAARLVVAGPGSTIAPFGFALAGRYVRRALDRLGVEPEVLAIGPYKTAGELLVRDAMSAEQREQLGAVLDAYHGALVTALAAGRGVSEQTAARWIDEAPYHARDAAARGLVDVLAYDDELEDAIHERPAEPSHAAPSQGERARPPRIAPAASYLSARRALRFAPLGVDAFVGVVQVHGIIVPRARYALAPVAAEDRVVAALAVARENRRVRAVVLHVDSRGGSALASDRIHHEVARLACVKPVVAYLGDVAASGGYYVASAAHAIVAQAQAITGSIGVVSARVVLAPLLERLGITTEVVKRGARADLLAATRPLTADEREAIRREMAAIYDGFVRVVAEGRRRPVADVEPLAGGRVWSGADAHARGLVDVLGGFDRAVAEARSLAGKGAERLEARLVAPPRVRTAASALPIAALVELAGPLGEAVAEPLHLALHLEGERVLAYSPLLPA